MKKIVTLFMALVMTMGLMAVPAGIRLDQKESKSQMVKPAKAERVKHHLPATAFKRRAVLVDESVTFEFEDQSSVSQEEEGFSVKLEKGTGSNAPAYYDSGMRLYANNTITIEGEDIIQIDIKSSKQGKKDYATLSVNTGDLESGGTSTSETDVKTDVWTGTAEKIVFTVGKGQRLLQEIVVTYDGVETKDTIEIAMMADFQWSEGETIDWEAWAYVYYVEAFLSAKNDSVKFNATIAATSEDEITFLDNKWSSKNMDEVELIINNDTLDCSRLTFLATQVGDTTYGEVKLKIDTVLYLLHLAYAIPEPVDTVVINFENCATMTYELTYGDYLIGNTSKQYGLLLDIYTDELAGEYTEEDLELSYSGLWQFAADTMQLPYYTLGVKITNENDTFRIKAEMFCRLDSMIYEIHTWYALPTPKDTIEWNIPYGGLYDATEDNGYFVVYGEYDEGESLQVYIGSEDVEGTFGYTSTYTSYSGIVYIDGEDTTFVTFLDITTKIELIDDSTADVQINALGTDSIRYEITMTAYIETAAGEAYEYDSEEDLEDSFNVAAGDEVSWNTDYFDDENYVELSGVKADGSAEAYIAFYSETKIPEAGEYDINDSGEIPSVVASPGYDGEYVYSSLYYTVADEYIEYLWFIVAGTVTVSDEMVEVDGVNAKGYAVKLKFIFPVTGMDAVKAAKSAVKRMVNGQLLIQKNDAKFNVLGQEIK